MNIEQQQVVVSEAARRGLTVQGDALLDEQGELVERPVDLLALGLFLGVLRVEVVAT